MRTVLFTVYLLLVLAAMPQASPGSIDLVVSLINGQIRGEYVTVKGADRRVRQYLGIPFALPPVGPLRFAAPRNAEPWEGERDGTHHPPMCIQNPEEIVNASKTKSLQYTAPELSEDCLYLNVYTPAEAKKGDKLPVIVWIHGGGLVIGAASQYDGAPLTAYENIVMVIIQYRLGILGFLSTGDEHAPGNWGFLDQLAALRWVQENIEAFGGNPQSVTVGGESTGAISASILTLSPQAKGLFHRAIFQSGVSMVGTTSHPLGQAKIVANSTGCDRSSTEELVQCMKTRSEDELVDVTKKLRIFLGVAVDGVFMTDTAEELLKRKEVLKVPLLMGLTNHEFGWILPQNFAPLGWERGMNRESVLGVVNMFNPGGASSVNNLIIDEYLKNAKTSEEIRDAFTDIMGDLLMTLPIVSVAGYHSDAGAPVYLYEYVYRAELHKHTRPSFVKADHADDVGFVFGGCFWNGPTKFIGNFTMDDERFCRTMMNYWASFARTGSPNGPGLVSWPQYDTQKQEYMELDLTPTVRQKLRGDKVHFATVILPQRLQQLAAAATATNPGN